MASSSLGFERSPARPQPYVGSPLASPGCAAGGERAHSRLSGSLRSRLSTAGAPERASLAEPPRTPSVRPSRDEISLALWSAGAAPHSLGSRQRPRYSTAPDLAASGMSPRAPLSASAGAGARARSAGRAARGRPISNGVRGLELAEEGASGASSDEASGDDDVAKELFFRTLEARAGGPLDYGALNAIADDDDDTNASGGDDDDDDARAVRASAERSAAPCAPTARVGSPHAPGGAEADLSAAHTRPRARVAPTPPSPGAGGKLPAAAPLPRPAFSPLGEARTGHAASSADMPMGSPLPAARGARHSPRPISGCTEPHRASAELSTPAPHAQPTARSAGGSARQTRSPPPGARAALSDGARTLRRPSDARAGADDGGAGGDPTQPSASASALSSPRSSRLSAAGAGPADGEGTAPRAKSEPAAEAAGEAGAREQQQLQQLKRLTHEKRALERKLEATTREAARERERLRERIGELEAKASERASLDEWRAELARGTAAPELKLSGQQGALLAADVRAQERLITGYQAENERLVGANRELGAELTRLRARERQAAGGGARAAGLGAEANEAPPAGEQLQAHVRQQAEALAEAQLEIDRLRSAKKELEARAGGVDLGALSAEGGLLQEAEARHAAAQQALHAQLSEMRGRLLWYAENQALLDDLASAANLKDARIAELEAALRLPRDEGGALAASEARVLKLEGQVAQLGEMLQGRAPRPLRPAGKGGGESLAELIRAAGPSEEQRAASEQAAAQLAEARAALARAEASHERKLRTLRQQHERVKADYESKIALLDEQLSPAALGGARLRAKELQAQVDELRAFYSKKVRALEARLAAAGGGGGTAGEGGPQASPTLERRAAPARAQPPGVGAGDEPPAPRRLRALCEERDALAARLEASEERCAMLQAEGARLGQMAAAFSDTSVELVCGTVSRLAARLEGEVAAAAGQVDELAKDAALATGRRLPASVAEMSRRLLELEAKHASREDALRATAERVRHAADVELFVLRQECSNALRLKDLQIEGFRAELDGLISGLGAMQA